MAARTILRSTAPVTRSTAARVASASKPRTAGSPFSFGTQKPLSARIFRSPVELSALSMLPYHSVTASALLTSMLSVNPRTFGWTLVGSKPARIDPLQTSAVISLPGRLFVRVPFEQ